MKKIGLLIIFLFGIMGSIATAQVSNISHIQNANVVRVYRSADASTNTVEGALLQPNDSSFGSIGSSVPGTNFLQFVVSRNGEHTIRLTAYDANGQRVGRQINYTFTITDLGGQSQGNGEGIPYVPTVGPEKNILLTIGIIFILYGSYRWKRSHTS